MGNALKDQGIEEAVAAYKKAPASQIIQLFSITWGRLLKSGQIDEAMKALKSNYA